MSWVQRSAALVLFGAAVAVLPRLTDWTSRTLRQGLETPMTALQYRAGGGEVAPPVPAAGQSTTAEFASAWADGDVPESAGAYTWLDDEWYHRQYWRAGIYGSEGGDELSPADFAAAFHAAVSPDRFGGAGSGAIP